MGTFYTTTLGGLPEDHSMYEPEQSPTRRAPIPVAYVSTVPCCSPSRWSLADTVITRSEHLDERSSIDVRRTVCAANATHGVARRLHLGARNPY